MTDNIEKKNFFVKWVNLLERMEYKLENIEYSVVPMKEVVEKIKRPHELLNKTSIKVDIDEEKLPHILVIVAVGVFSLITSFVFALMRNHLMALTMLFLFLGMLVFLFSQLIKMALKTMADEFQQNPELLASLENLRETVWWYGEFNELLSPLQNEQNFFDRRSNSFPSTHSLNGFFEIIEYLDLDIEKTFLCIPYTTEGLLSRFKKNKDDILAKEHTAVVYFMDDFPKSSQEVTGTVMEIERQSYGFRKNAGYVRFIPDRNTEFVKTRKLSKRGLISKYLKWRIRNYKDSNR